MLSVTVINFIEHLHLTYVLATKRFQGS